MYHVFLNSAEVGTTALESADPPMGVVTGKIAFLPSVSPFRLFYAEEFPHHRQAYDERFKA